MIHVGDALTVLRTLPAGSVQCCVTSPPYWGLRDYGTARWDGGDAACDHLAPPRGGSGQRTTLAGTHNREGYSADGQFRETCGKCGARRIDQQLGLEPTPDAFVERLVEVFREVRRVLRDDGTLWLNLGDTYSTQAGRVGERPGGGAQGDAWKDRGAMTSPNRMPLEGLKPKDLIGVPWRAAFALQADGWWLRSDIVWHKPNPMPESITDRPTRAHEFVFLLSKSQRYRYDAEAIAEPTVGDGRGSGNKARTFGGAVGDRPADGLGRGVPCEDENGTRNRRTVWTIGTEVYTEAHFAVMPTELVRPCILAGSRQHDTVLDPFAGAGTVGVVAARLQRRFVGIELNPTYAELARRRIADDAPLFASPPVPAVVEPPVFMAEHSCGRVHADSTRDGLLRALADCEAASARSAGA